MVDPTVYKDNSKESKPKTLIENLNDPGVVQIATRNAERRASQLLSEYQEYLSWCRENHHTASIYEFIQFRRRRP